MHVEIKPDQQKGKQIAKAQPNQPNQPNQPKRKTINKSPTRPAKSANKPERTNKQVRSSRHKTFQKTNKQTIPDTPNRSLNIYSIDQFNKPSYYPNHPRQSLSPPKSFCIKN